MLDKQTMSDTDIITKGEVRKMIIELMKLYSSKYHHAVAFTESDADPTDKAKAYADVIFWNASWSAVFAVIQELQIPTSRTTNDPESIAKDEIRTVMIRLMESYDRKYHLARMFRDSREHDADRFRAEVDLTYWSAAWHAVGALATELHIALPEKRTPPGTYLSRRKHVKKYVVPASLGDMH